MPGAVTAPRTHLRAIARNGAPRWVGVWSGGLGFSILRWRSSFRGVWGGGPILAAPRDLYATGEMAGVPFVQQNEQGGGFIKKIEKKREFVFLDPPRAGLG